MKEISDIILAYQRAVQEGVRMALATVVMVEGSSYRQPGARMLVMENGQLTGAISGGCLEGNALQKALLAIHQQRNKLVTYDATDDEDDDLAVQLGCNGIVHILFEPIDAGDPGNPVALLEKLQHSREGAVVLTRFSLTQKAYHPGTSAHPMPGLREDIQLAKRKKQTFLKKIISSDYQGEILIEYIAPAVSLVIAGAGNDVKPLVAAAAILGWEVTVADGRATHALAHRFPQAAQVIYGTPQQVAAGLKVDPFTVFVLMTHNYKYDLAMMKQLIGTEAPYIGTLGPKARLRRMYRDLAEAGIKLDQKQEARIYGPAGLAIGAETPDEIAISIVAEIKAVLAKANGRSLKFLKKKMHEDIPVIS